MNKTIIYFTGVYDTLDLFTEELRRAFEDMGYLSFVYDANHKEESKEALLAQIESYLEKTGKSPCEAGEGFAGIAFNNLGYNLDFAIRDTDAATFEDGQAARGFRGEPAAKYLGALRDSISEYFDGPSVPL